MQGKLKLFTILIVLNFSHQQNLRVIESVSKYTPTIFEKTDTINTNTHSDRDSEGKKQVIGDVELSHHIPSTFLVGEIFQFVGNINSSKLNSYLWTRPSNTKIMDLNIRLTNKETGQNIVCTLQMFTTQTSFTHQCLFEIPGQYFLSINIGNRNSTTPKIYNVVDPESMPARPMKKSNIPIKPQNLTLNVISNDLYINWTPNAKLTKIVFLQPFPYLNRKQFIISNDRGLLKVPYVQFQNFSKVATTIQVSHAESSDLSAMQRTTEFSQTENLIFNVTDHLFRQIRYQQVKLDKQIKSKVNVNEMIEIQGQSIDQVREKAFVVNPKYQIEEKNLEMRVSPKSHRFRFQDKIRDQGVYLVEINHAEGYALINTPIYAGSSFPLLPDFMDLHPNHQRNIQQQKKMSLNQMREQLLVLINKKRRQSGVDEVVLDDELNELAQLHAKDMAIKGYVSHTNLNGENAGDRAKKMGILSPVGENIAVNDDLEYGRYQLDRSPIHLKNTINSLWTRVGIGIYQKYNGYYYFTEEYSCQDKSKALITPQIISQIKKTIFLGLQAKAPVSMTYNIQFSRQLQQWFDKNPDVLANIESLKILLSKKRLKTIKFIKFSVPYINGFVKLVEQGGFLDYKGTKSVGIATHIVDGNIQAFMILS